MSSQEHHHGTIAFTPLQLGALSLLMVMAFAGPIAMPFNLSAIAVQYGTDNTVAGMVAAAEMLSVSISSLVISRYVMRLPVRMCLTGAVVVVAAANLATLFIATSPATLAPCRIIAGLATGTAVAMVMSIAGRSTNPSMTFGVTNGSIGVMGMGLSLGLPVALGAYGLMGAYGVYLACALVSLPLIALVPVPARPAASADTSSNEPPFEVPALPAAGWIALCGLGLVFLGHGSLVMIIVQIGLDVPLSLETIGQIFFFGSMLTIVAPVAAGFLGQGLSASGRVIGILSILIVAAYFLSSVEAPLSFYIAGPVFAALPLAIMPIVLAAFMMMDPSARLVGAHPAFVTLAGALAPFVGGFTSDIGGYAFTGVFAIVSLVSGGALLMVATRRADRHRKEVTTAPLAAE